MKNKKIVKGVLSLGVLATLVVPVLASCGGDGSSSSSTSASSTPVETMKVSEALALSDLGTKAKDYIVSHSQNTINITDSSKVSVYYTSNDKNSTSFDTITLRVFTLGADGNANYQIAVGKNLDAYEVVHNTASSYIISVQNSSEPVAKETYNPVKEAVLAKLTLTEEVAFSYMATPTIEDNQFRFILEIATTNGLVTSFVTIENADTIDGLVANINSDQNKWSHEEETKTYGTSLSL